MPRPRTVAFTVRPVTSCPRLSTGMHRWIEDGDRSDLLAYGRPDHGVAVHLGRCTACGTALLAIGQYGTDSDARGTVFELPDAELPED